MAWLFGTFLFCIGFCFSWCYIVQHSKFSKEYGNSIRLKMAPEKIVSPTIVTSVTQGTQEATNEIATYEPYGSEFCICANCKTAYLLSRSTLGKKGKVVKCTICSKEWFQNPDRLMHTDDMNFLTDLTTSKIAALKMILDDNISPRFSRTDRFEVFVGNVPYSFEEKQILDLFAEYGISSISIARDQVGNNKGFCFLEFAKKEDADSAVKEMDGFFVDRDKKLSVRSALGYVKGSKKKK